MTPSSESVNLPPVEQLPVPAVPVESAPQTHVEQGAHGMEHAGNTSNGGAAALPVIPLPIPQSTPVNSVHTDDSSTTVSTALPTTDDKDLIEKEWVNKAKQIVERTRDDPRRQSDELTVVKADYLKSHYNKTVKLSK